MNPLLEGAVGVLLIVAALALLIVLAGLPRGLGLAFRLVLIACWFWWRGWEALLGLVILEIIGGGVLLVDPIAEVIEERQKRNRRPPP